MRQTRARTAVPTTINEKALRYIDAHLSDDLRLEDVASHVYQALIISVSYLRNTMESGLMHGKSTTDGQRS